MFSARERTRPRLGKIDVDYQSLHDAFFKHQKKFYLPKLRQRLKIHNQLYYENEEFQGIFRHKRLDRKNNKISNKLRLALGMTSSLTPPSWLKNMQRYGPPMSYPGLKIPGLNAPIPAGASFGDHVNGWGRPPVDLHGQPLYGMDVFAKNTDEDEKDNEKVVHWGEMESDVEYETDSDDEMDIDEDDEEVKETRFDDETPVVIEQEKEIIEDETIAVDEALELRKATLNQAEKQPDNDEEKALFKVIDQTSASLKKGELHGSNFAYDLNNNKPAEEGTALAITKEQAIEEESDDEETEANFKF